jgi:hypothetical protein
MTMLPERLCVRDPHATFAQAQIGFRIGLRAYFSTQEATFPTPNIWRRL